MPYNHKSQMEAIEAMIPKLYYEIYRPIAEARLEVYVTPEPVKYADRMAGERKLVGKGDVWGKEWDCGWFRITGKIPECAKGQKVVLYLDIHGEICIFDQDGVPLMALTSGSCLRPSQDFGCFGIRKRELVLSEKAKGGEAFEFWGDAGCNYITGVGIANRPDTGKIEFADIAVCRDNVKELFYDSFILYDLMKELTTDSARYYKIRQALFEASTVLFDYTDDEIAGASVILKKELNKKGGDPDLTISALGHSHIDLAWKWPIRETHRKAARTFSNTLYFMDKYPDYKFGASQAQLYSWVKEEHPALYEKIKEKVKEGRWEVQGAMWVEPDANVTGGESFVRQILYGKRFFREEFGEDMKILWLPDVFGYSSALPQILKKSGVPYFLTIKLGWGNRHNKHPHQTFRWIGLDGSEVLSHMPPEGDYNSFALPFSLKKIEKLYEDKAICDEAMMLYGIGDGGGGAGELQHEALLREKNLSGLPPVKQEMAIEFFERINEKKESYPAFDGELYFEMHQGTYTSQARNKRYNRKLEKLLREAEFAAVVTGSEYPKKQLDDIWKEVLLYQFHDILPGSSIQRVYDESLARYKVLYSDVRELISKIYGKGDYAINSLSWDRSGWHKIHDNWYNLTVPAMGSVKLADPIMCDEKNVAYTGVMENEFVKVEFADDGSIKAVLDKKNNREVLTDASNRFAVYKDDGDAWDFNESYRDTTPKYFTLTEIKAYEDGPEKSVRTEYTYGKSKLWQTVSIVEGSPVICFDTRVEWNERNKMLRTSFYTGILANEVSCDIQYGTLKRPNHDNNNWDMAKFEICAHKYADISESNYGVALMNDCKYGYCVKGGMLDLNLLRSPGYPDETADHATHTFKYALYPHNHMLEQSDVLQKSYEFNQPLWTGEKIEQMFTVSNPDVVVESVKKAEDSDEIIVRMYETKGGRCETGLHFYRPVKSAKLVNLMEEEEKNIDPGHIPFHKFEIVTVKVEL